MKRHRRKLLAAALVATVLAVFSDRIQSAFTRPLRDRELRRQRYEKEVQKRELEVARARKAAQELAMWQQQALPSDSQVARSLYQAWLLDLVARVGLMNHAVDAGEPRTRGPIRPITFSVQGRGTLDQLTHLLHEFYRADHLHQVQSLVLTPVGRDDLLDLSIQIEAVSLATADRKDRLSAGRANRLAFASVDDYGVIARRNVFSTSGPVDPTDHAVLTGVNYVNGEPEAWFSLRTEADPEKSLLKLRPGADFAVGQFQGTVVRIDENDVVLESDGERWLVSIGETLAQAFALPPEY